MSSSDDCHSTNWDTGTVPNVVLEPPPWGTRSVSVDACLVDVIRHLWANGIVTGGCCCGHGIERPEVHLYPGHDVAAVAALIAEVDDRSFNIIEPEGAVR